MPIDLLSGIIPKPKESMDSGLRRTIEAVIEIQLLTTRLLCRNRQMNLEEWKKEIEALIAKSMHEASIKTLRQYLENIGAD